MPLNGQELIDAYRNLVELIIQNLGWLLTRSCHLTMPSVLILLAVYDGGLYLEEQLQSLADQTIESVHILASDDGSTDSSIRILETAQELWTKGEFRIIEGPQKGFARNFRELILNSEIDADYFAFCDQDDVWDRDKLERAIVSIGDHNPSRPRVCASRTRLINEKGEAIGYSRRISMKPGFGNALVQNIASGNTFVFDKNTRNLLIKTIDNIGDIAHDYWTYIIVTGVGGVFIFDPQPSVSYRQHQSNAIGHRTSWRFIIWRFNRALKKQIKMASNRRIAALDANATLLTPTARLILEDYKLMRNSGSLWQRLSALHRSGIYRLSWRGQLALYVDCIFRIL